MNINQKSLLRVALLIIFLLIFYLFIRLITPSVNFFVISIILLGLLFFTEYTQLVIHDPLLMRMGELNYAHKLFKNENNKRNR